MGDVDLISDLWNAAGPWSLPVIAVILSIRIFRSGSVQNYLPDRWSWENLPVFARWAIVFTGSLSASVATAVATGAGWLAAVYGAIPVALGAVLGHKATKRIGHAMHSRSFRGDVGYKASKFRKSASIIVPLDPKLPK